VVFVCENNQYMEYTPIGDVIPVERPAADRAAAYGLDRVLVDGNDVEAVLAVVGGAVERARDGAGPALVEADTYCLKGHSVADAGKYRPTEEVERWRARDPLLLAREALRANGTVESALDGVDARCRAEVAELAEKVLAAPPAAAAGVWSDVWSDGSWQWRN